METRVSRKTIPKPPQKKYINPLYSTPTPFSVGYKSQSNFPALAYQYPSRIGLNKSTDPFVLRKEVKIDTSSSNVSGYQNKVRENINFLLDIHGKNCDRGDYFACWNKGVVNTSSMFFEASNFIITDSVATTEGCVTDPSLRGCAEIAIDVVKPAKFLKKIKKATKTSNFATKEIVKATAKINGGTFKGVNQLARDKITNGTTLIADRILKKEAKYGIKLPNGTRNTAHAEIEAIQKAFDAGGTSGGNMTMAVTGKPLCSYCLGDIPKMAESANLKSLIIFEKTTDKKFIWLPNKKSLQELIK